MANTIFKLEKQKISISGKEGDLILTRIVANETFYEIQMLNYIKRLGLTGCAIDAGAHVGNHTIFLAKFCNFDKVLAFEPNPESLNYLRQNISENALTRIVGINGYGLASNSAEMHMTIPQEANSGGARISEHGDFAVQVKRLDDVVHDEAISLIKIDVEGYEIELLLGALVTIQKSRPHIFIEAQSSERLNEISEVLAPASYSIGPKFNSTPTYHFYPKEWTYELLDVIDDLSVRNLDLMTSYSWRLTSPLRTFTRLVRRFNQGVKKMWRGLKWARK